MKYRIINPDEDWQVTLGELRKRDVRIPGDRSAHREVNAADCDIYRRGHYWVIEHDGKVLYYESHSEEYPFFEMAFHYMNVEKRAKWKTVDNLTRFRQAIREDAVNWRGLSEMLVEPLTKKVFDEFMRYSRAADLVHHGSNTF